MTSGRSPEQRVVEDLADVAVGAAVVASGADESTAVVVVDRDLVAGSGEPGQDGACFTELVSEVGGHPGRCSGALGLDFSLGQDLGRRGRPRRCQGQRDRRGPVRPPCTCPNNSARLSSGPASTSKQCSHRA